MRVGISPRPRLDAGVEIKRPLFATQLDQRDARNVDRDVEQEVAATDPAVENGAVIVPRQRRFDEAHAVLRSDFLAAQFGGDDDDLLRPHVDVAQQQRQNALPDAAEADDRQTSGKADMRLVGHGGERYEGWPPKSSRRAYACRSRAA